MSVSKYDPKSSIYSDLIEAQKRREEKLEQFEASVGGMSLMDYQSLFDKEPKSPQKEEFFHPERPFQAPEFPPLPTDDK